MRISYLWDKRVLVFGKFVPIGLLILFFVVGILCFFITLTLALSDSTTGTEPNKSIFQKVAQKIESAKDNVVSSVTGKPIAKKSATSSTAGSDSSNGTNSSNPSSNTPTGSDPGDDSDNGGQTPPSTPTPTPEPTYVLVAIGDSITNAASPQPDMTGDNPSYSFSTGTSINSVYQHLLSQGLQIDPIRLAVSGAKSADAASGQAPQVGGHSPRYVTVLIGGNDIRSLIAPDTFANNLNSIASQIQADGRTVLIGTIPNYADMMKADIPACNEDPLSPIEEAGLAWMLSEYNNRIASVASAYGFTLVDLFSALGQGDISEADCLHPNLSGLAKIAARYNSAL